jgi:hypothetical protein
MTLSRKLLIVNASGVVGTLISFLILPNDTKFWPWVGIASAVLCLVNLLVLIPHRRQTFGTTGNSQNWLAYLIISLILIGIALTIRFGFH